MTFVLQDFQAGLSWREELDLKKPCRCQCRTRRDHQRAARPQHKVALPVHFVLRQAHRVANHKAAYNRQHTNAASLRVICKCIILPFECTEEKTSTLWYVHTVRHGDKRPKKSCKEYNGRYWDIPSNFRCCETVAAFLVCNCRFSFVLDKG